MLDKKVAKKHVQELEQRGTFRRLRFGTQLIILLFVVVTSFLYGFVSTLRQAPVHLAEASLLQGDELPESAAFPFELPSGVQAIPVGQNSTINGQLVQILNFVSERGAKELLQDFTALFERQGFLTAGLGTERRGVVIAVNEQTGKRLSVSLWNIGQLPRNNALKRPQLFGVLALSTLDALGVVTDETVRGEITDVPLRPGGEAGASFASDEGHGRSVTGTYTLPGEVAENLDYYRTELVNFGWIEKRAAEAGKIPAALFFERDGELLSMLFSLLPERAHEGIKKSVVIISKGAKKSWGAAKGAL